MQEAPYLSICDNTAPTSPASPEAADVEDMEFEGPLNPPVHPLKPSPRALFSPGVGRNIIPDRENPPQEILDWVSIFSRYNLEHLVVVKSPNLRNLRRSSNIVGFTWNCFQCYEIWAGAQLEPIFGGSAMRFNFLKFGLNSLYREGLGHHTVKVMIIFTVRSRSFSLEGQDHFPVKVKIIFTLRSRSFSGQNGASCTLRRSGGSTLGPLTDFNL